MNIVITTKNQAKINAVKDAFNNPPWSDFLPIRYTLSTISVNSNVSETPSNDTEGKQGVLNRIAAARLQIQSSDIIIAMEGIVENSNNYPQIRGWVGVYQKSTNRLVIASGCSTPIPNKYISLTKNSSKNFGELIQKKYPKIKGIEGIKLIGANGLFTNGKYPRDRSFTDALEIAGSVLLLESNW
ncbi:DUF84 family protein [Candidatus Saccharibacteria bacterium]|nr:DUF84 family protein [Candidatus Saccharibacteria bacterium]MCB9834890.1 DUF84 family protein [Candidatus Nomurabacteria bacterium]